MTIDHDLRIAEQIIRGATYATAARQANMSPGRAYRLFHRCLYRLRETYPADVPASIRLRGIRTHESEWLELIARYRREHAAGSVAPHP